MDTREKLIQALKAHDWYYERSDDHGVWMRGQSAWDRIQFLAKQVEDGQELIAQYKKR